MDVADNGRPTGPLVARADAGWRRARAIVRLVALGLWTGTGFSALVVGQAIVGRTTPRARRFRQRMFKAWCALVLRTLAIDMSVVGRLPEAPYLLVTNHLSYIDILVIGSRLETVFLARHDLAGWPIIGWAAERLGTLFINRRDFGDLRAVNAAIAAVVERGDGLVVFPEGTTTSGRTVSPFRSPVLEPAAALQLPVAYGALRYATPPGEAPAGDVVCWWGDAEFAPHFWGMLHLSRIDAMLSLGPDRLSDGDRKVLAQELHRKVSALFVPVDSGDDG